jgi:hypothetical protein
MIAGAETSDIGRSRGDTCQVGRAAEMTRYSAPRQEGVCGDTQPYGGGVEVSGMPVIRSVSQPLVMETSVRGLGH